MSEWFEVSVLGDEFVIEIEARGHGRRVVGTRLGLRWDAIELPPDVQTNQQIRDFCATPPHRRIGVGKRK